MDFYESNKSFRGFCIERLISSNRVSLMHYATEIGLFDHKANKTPYSFVHKKLFEHLKQKEASFAVVLDQLHESNRSLTVDEEKMVVEMCTQMAAMGLGVDCETCLLVVNAIFSKRISAEEFTPVGNWRGQQNCCTQQ